MNYDTAQLVVPLMDFVVRWGIFNAAARQATRDYVATAGFENDEMSIIESFLNALDDYNNREDNT